MASCQACGATVIWKHNDKTGKRAPIDVEPHGEGNIVFRDAEHYHVLTKTEMKSVGQASLFEQPPCRYRAHFATCPEAFHFRRCGKCHKTPCVCVTV